MHINWTATAGNGLSMRFWRQYHKKRRDVATPPFWLLTELVGGYSKVSVKLPFAFGVKEIDAAFVPIKKGAHCAPVVNGNENAAG